MRSAITDGIWDVMGPMVQRCKSPLGPAPDLPDRLFFEAVLYWARVGCPWRDLPGDFGGWSAVSKRLRRRIDSGRLRKLFEAMAAQPACDGTLRVMIDSTIVRAFAKAKQFRRFATRYEKLREVFLGPVQLVFGFIHVRKTALSVNTPYTFSTTNGDLVASASTNPKSISTIFTPDIKFSLAA